MNATTTKPSLKGSEFYGEFYPQNKSVNMIGFLYRLADKSFAIVKKEDFTGRILSIEPIEGKTVRRFGGLNLGYHFVNFYCLK